MAERKVFVVSVLLTRSGGSTETTSGVTVTSTTTFTQHRIIGGSEAEAIVTSLKQAQKMKRGFAIEEWLVTEVTQNMFNEGGEDEEG